MPLIIICGIPSSGKTHRAKQLRSYFQQHSATLPSPPRIHLISDASLNIPRTVYDLESKGSNERSNNSSEKDARATIYGAVKRVLSNNDVVILDAAGGNYIKGWRYQLYCEAKAVRTGSCVVHIGTARDVAKGVNERRLKNREERLEKGTEEVQDEIRNGDGTKAVGFNGGNESQTQDKLEGQDTEEPYEPDTWENLVYRFEEPNAMARWDKPLFTVLWEDSTPPCSAIWDAVIASPDGKKIVVRPNQATVLKPATSEDYLYELDRATQDIVAKIVEYGKDHVGEGGGEVLLDDGLVVELPQNPVALPALQRLRRAFISLNRTQGTVGLGRIREGFVGFLNDGFQAA